MTTYKEISLKHVNLSYVILIFFFVMVQENFTTDLYPNDSPNDGGITTNKGEMDLVGTTEGTETTNSTSGELQPKRVISKRSYGVKFAVGAVVCTGFTLLLIVWVLCKQARMDKERLNNVKTQPV